MSNEFKAGDRAYTKVGRNLVEVRVKAKTETGWTVTTRTGRTLAVRSLETVPGAAAGIASAAFGRTSPSNTPGDTNDTPNISCANEFQYPAPAGNPMRKTLSACTSRRCAR